MKIKKVLIANRGEIALRIIRACHELGIDTVAVYSQADRNALHVLHAKEALCIGPPLPQKSYLNKQAIFSAAELTGADAIHPGFGFFSESAEFAQLCIEKKLTFIGPSPQQIALLGNKTSARTLAQQVNCPLLPGSPGIVADSTQALECAKKIGFPVIIKASAGGGGKGIRIAHTPKELSQQFALASSEAQANFGWGALYVEKYLPWARHIEIQVIGDLYGNYQHFGERDCSMQRRRQKLLEESPSPILKNSLREEIADAALRLVQAAQYHSVGTVEFLLDQENNFYFMEVNTRIQVEHTVTEERFNIDLVKEQISIAAKEPLSFSPLIEPQGHVIQCRINAENSACNFSPSPGTIHQFIPPGGPRVRVDTACYSGCEISPYYDSMIAKIIAKGPSRKSALATLYCALQECQILGIKTTLPFHQTILQENEAFVKNTHDIHYVDSILCPQYTE